MQNVCSCHAIFRGVSARRGTGCAAPSVLRESSGMLLRLHELRPAAAAAAGEGGAPPPGFLCLIDAGEGALSAMRRQFGAADSARLLRELTCVWISHMHAVRAHADPSSSPNAFSPNAFSPCCAGLHAGGHNYPSARQLCMGVVMRLRRALRLHTRSLRVLLRVSRVLIRVSARGRTITRGYRRCWMPARPPSKPRGRATGPRRSRCL
jgi:hypothetical protein